jgi:excisionase family DNA binding protein
MTEAENRSKLKFYTTNEIAELLKMNVQVIARKLKHGELTGYKIGKDWRVRESDLLEWLEKHSNKSVMDPARKVVERFMRNGRFETLPVQRKRRRYILEYILDQFEQNRIYTEKEVNEIISRYHDDYCLIRREFICEKMMSRKDSKYRRNGSYLSPK